MNEGVTQDGAMPHRVITVPDRSSPALAPCDVITGLVPVIPIGKAQRLSASDAAQAGQDTAGE
jgi:hypothetical protein